MTEQRLMELEAWAIRPGFDVEYTNALIELTSRVRTLQSTLTMIGRLTRWAAWLLPLHASGAADMVEIRRLAEVVLGRTFDEYT